MLLHPFLIALWPIESLRLKRSYLARDPKKPRSRASLSSRTEIYLDSAFFDRLSLG